MPRRRYKEDLGVQGEFEPGSDGRVLRNKLGLKTVRAINAAEFLAFLAARERHWNTITPDIAFTSALIRQIHADFMGGIYEWGGHYRTVNLSKGDFQWPPALLVPDNMAALERDVLRPLTPCRPGPLERVAHDIAVVHAELLFVHPFRDGNGRVARLIAELMALQAGLPPIAFTTPGTTTGRTRAAYINAVGRGYGGDYGPLTRLVQEAVEAAMPAFMEDSQAENPPAGS